MALWVPNVLLGPMSLGIVSFLGHDTGMCRDPLSQSPMSRFLNFPGKRTYSNSVLAIWGRMQLGSDGLNRTLPGLLPFQHYQGTPCTSETHDIKAFGSDFNRFNWIVRNLDANCLTPSSAKPIYQVPIGMYKCPVTRFRKDSSRDTRRATRVALCFLWYRRLSLLHLHFFP